MVRVVPSALDVVAVERLELEEPAHSELLLRARVHSLVRLVFPALAGLLQPPRVPEVVEQLQLPRLLLFIPVPRLVAPLVPGVPLRPLEPTDVARPDALKKPLPQRVHDFQERQELVDVPKDALLARDVLAALPPVDRPALRRGTAPLPRKGRVPARVVTVADAV